MLQRSVLQVGGWATQLLRLEASSAQPQLQVWVIPGNPGVAAFYQVFIQQLHAAFGGTATVSAISNLGHDSEGLTGSATVHCLDTQVQHKVALLQEQVLAPGRPPAVLIAHSIGAHMVLHAMRQLRDKAAAAAGAADGGSARLAQQVRKVICLMPFLATDWSSPRQRILRLLAPAGPVLAAGAAVLGSLPARLQDLLLAATQPGAEPHAREGCRALMRASSVRNNFHLAMHEFRDLDRPVDWELLRALGSQVAVLCAPDDIWWPKRHFEEMREAVPDIEEYYSDKIDHAFCMSTEQCAIVTDVVREATARALQGQVSSDGGGSGSSSRRVDLAVELADDAAEDKVAAAGGKARARERAPAGPSGAAPQLAAA